MKFSKIKAMIALLFGGMSGIVKYVLDAFNSQVLAKLPNKEAGTKYLKDAQAVYSLLRAIMENHADDLSEKRKKSLIKILDAIEELTKALEDFTIEPDELDAIVEKVKDAIDAYKKNK